MLVGNVGRLAINTSETLFPTRSTCECPCIFFEPLLMQDIARVTCLQNDVGVFFTSN